MGAGGLRDRGKRQTCCFAMLLLSICSFEENPSYYLLCSDNNIAHHPLISWHLSQVFNSLYLTQTHYLIFSYIFFSLLSICPIFQPLQLILKVFGRYMYSMRTLFDLLPSSCSRPYHFRRQLKLSVITISFPAATNLLRKGSRSAVYARWGL